MLFRSRKECFAALLKAYNLPSSDLSRRTSSALQDRSAAALTPKPGVLEPFKQLKAREKNTVIVTEGPRDAQKWTVEQLGLAPYVDVLATLNEIGLAKDVGLFGEVLERCGIRKEDVVPAKAVDVLAALFNERDGYRDVRVGEGNGEDVLRVNSLTEIGYWLQDSDSNGQS